MADTALFASYNVHKCVGSDRRFDPGRIAAVIAEINPDVIALQEADRRFGDRAGLLDLAALREATGLEPVPVANGHRGHGWHGNLLLTRGGATRRVRQVTLPGLEPRGALMADIELTTGAIRVLGVHLGLLRHSRLLQVNSLLSHAVELTDLPVILMGDMNEWRRERRSALLGFDAGLGPMQRGVPSFPAYYPVLALDRMVARPAGILGQVEVHDSPLARRASDHLPIKARVTLG
ncbi:MAG: EEP domain-containing protein [Rhodovulum sulfidophilum]|uniref:EEP domain-containing protein n=1 Tax=Rhodovulum sulfidophilum TaxID=35806 RepID=A0A2W5Q6V1_RHOSU|nr:MAG: EEP domain-containing protein [Rhodovulum sulfidophilum]